MELIAVNPEGLTTADEKLLVKNEALLSQKSWPSSGDGWQSSGKGSKGGAAYSWTPNPKGKGKKDGGKGKKGAKGKKGESKGKDDLMPPNPKPMGHMGTGVNAADAFPSS